MAKTKPTDNPTDAESVPQEVETTSQPENTVEKRASTRRVIDAFGTVREDF